LPLQPIAIIKNECFKWAAIAKKWINDWFWMWLQKQIGTNSITSTTSSCSFKQIKKVRIIHIRTKELVKKTQKIVSIIKDTSYLEYERLKSILPKFVVDSARAARRRKII